MRIVPPLGLVALFILAILAPAFADMSSDRLAITGRLKNWSQAFNTRKPAALCELFADDLIATIRPTRAAAASARRSLGRDMDRHMGEDVSRDAIQPD